MLTVIQTISLCTYLQNSTKNHRSSPEIFLPCTPPPSWDVEKQGTAGEAAAAGRVHLCPTGDCWEPGVRRAAASWGSRSQKGDTGWPRLLWEGLWLVVSHPSISAYIHMPTHSSSVPSLPIRMHAYIISWHSELVGCYKPSQFICCGCGLCCNMLSSLKSTLCVVHTLWAVTWQI